MDVIAARCRFIGGVLGVDLQLAPITVSGAKSNHRRVIDIGDGEGDALVTSNRGRSIDHQTANGAVRCTDEDVIAADIGTQDRIPTK